MADLVAVGPFMADLVAVDPFMADLVVMGTFMADLAVWSDYHRSYSLNNYPLFCTEAKKERQAIRERCCYGWAKLR